MRKTLIISILFIIHSTFAQGGIEPTSYQVRTFLGINTRGGLPSSFKIQYLHYTDKYRQTGVGIEFANIKHQKEVKYAVNNPYSPSVGSTVIYGKENHLFSIRPKVTFARTLFESGKENGTKLDFHLGIGPSIGLQKPYYVVYNNDNGTTETAPYDADREADIINSKGLLYKLGTADTKWGINASASFNVDLNSSMVLWGLEFGIIAEYYPSGVVIMPTDSKDKFFPLLFLNLYGGIRK